VSDKELTLKGAAIAEITTKVDELGKLLYPNSIDRQFRVFSLHLRRQPQPEPLLLEAHTIARVDQLVAANDKGFFIGAPDPNGTAVLSLHCRSVPCRPLPTYPQVGVFFIYSQAKKSRAFALKT